MSKGWYGHFVPKARLRDDYPFTYSMEVVEVVEKVDNEIDFFAGTNFEDTIHELLLKVFPFTKYLGRYSTHNIAEYEYIIKVNICTMENVEGKKKKERVVQSTGFIRVFNFSSNYRFTLVETLDQAKEILSEMTGKRIGFDTETSGLNPELDTLVGITLSSEDNEGYYFPINHNEKFSKHNLPKETVLLIYDTLVNAEVVYLFNARFDIRFMEYFDASIDFSKVNMVDTQISVYLADPDWKGINLKWAETHFLGYKRPDLADTLKLYDIEGFDTSQIDPMNLTFYACQDAISTRELGIITDKFVDEFQISGELDQQVIYPLMKMEDHPIRIDVAYLEKEIKKLNAKLKEMDKQLYDMIGDVNTNSPKQMQALFESFGLDTGVRTKTGAMSIGRRAVEDMIDTYKSEGKELPKWVTLFGDRNKTHKLITSFFEKFYEYVKLTDGRARLNYRMGSTATGRFSSGEER